MTLVALRPHPLVKAPSWQPPLPPARRRLSTIVKRHAPKGRAYIVSVHRVGDLSYAPTDGTVRLRRTWARTLVGRGDVVVITTLPRGGRATQIALTIGAVALLAAATFASGGIAAGLAGGLTGLGSFGAVTAGTGLTLAVQGTLTVGALAMAYAANRARANQAQRTAANPATPAETPSFSLTGGGNLPRPGGRKPLFYGRCWVQPPLSQTDVTIYEGQDVLLIKRMTLGIGNHIVHNIRIGDSYFWKGANWIPGQPPASGIQPPYNAAGGAAYGIGGSKTAGAGSSVKSYGPNVEFLLGTPSAIMPGDVYTNTEVSGIEIPRNGVYTSWKRAQANGTQIDQVQLDINFFRGLFSQNPANGAIGPGQAQVVFQARQLDANNNPISAEFDIVVYNSGSVQSQRPVRFSTFIALPSRGAYEVRAITAPLTPNVTNDVSWDGLHGISNDVRVRENTYEIVIGIRTSTGLPTASLSDIWVEASKIVDATDGVSWAPAIQLNGTTGRYETANGFDKAVYAYADLVRSSYGLNDPDGVDTAEIYRRASTIVGNDTFNGPLPDVSTFWEAAHTVLLPARMQPIKVGRIHSVVREEPTSTPRHVVSRRQIVRRTPQSRYTFAPTGGSGDVIVEFYRNGDPKFPDEARATIVPSHTPRRYQIVGVKDGTHAHQLAIWKAAADHYRGEEREWSQEHDGRLIAPGDQTLSDVWFLSGERFTAGVAAQLGAGPNGGPMLLLDADIPLPQGESANAVIRDRVGKEWGTVRAPTWDMIIPATPISERAVELHGPTVIALEAASGRALADVLSTDDQWRSTIVMSSHLEEVQRTYIVKGAVPSGDDQVTVTAVYDDPRVWAALGLDYTHPNPTAAPADPIQPAEFAVTDLRVYCQRVETGIEAVWAVNPVSGARTYRFELSWDGGVVWFPLPSDGGPRGRITIAQTEGVPAMIRAQAFGRTGVPNTPLAAAFTTTPVIVNVPPPSLLVNGQQPFSQPGGQTYLREPFAERGVYADGAFDQKSSDGASAGITGYPGAQTVIHGVKAGDTIEIEGSMDQFGTIAAVSNLTPHIARVSLVSGPSGVFSGSAIVLRELPVPFYYIFQADRPGTSGAYNAYSPTYTAGVTNQMSVSPVRVPIDYVAPADGDYAFRVSLATTIFTASGSPIALLWSIRAHARKK